MLWPDFFSLTSSSRFRYRLAVGSLRFLTHHAHVLMCVARDRHARLRDIAECVGITERAAHRLVVDLECAGYLTRRREGRRNVYEVRLELPLEHPMERPHPVGVLLSPLMQPSVNEAG